MRTPSVPKPAPSASPIALKNLHRPGTASPSKVSKTVKKIDLGAAAAFGNNNQSTHQPNMNANNVNNLDLFEDFDPRANDTPPSVSKDFGGFSSAPSSQVSQYVF